MKRFVARAIYGVALGLFGVMIVVALVASWPAGPLVVGGAAILFCAMWWADENR